MQLSNLTIIVTKFDHKKINYILYKALLGTIYIYRKQRTLGVHFINFYTFPRTTNVLHISTFKNFVANYFNRNCTNLLLYFCIKFILSFNYFTPLTQLDKMVKIYERGAKVLK